MRAPCKRWTRCATVLEALPPTRTLTARRSPVPPVPPDPIADELAALAAMRPRVEVTREGSGETRRGAGQLDPAGTDTPPTTPSSAELPHHEAADLVAPRSSDDTASSVSAPSSR